VSRFAQILRPAHLLPLAALALAAVNAGYSYGEPGFLVGGAAVLALLFGLVWVCGIRYPDVGWMIVVAALLPLEHAFSIADPRMQLVARGALALGYGAFLVAFYRMPTSRGRLWVYYLAGVGAVAMAGWFAPADVVARLVVVAPSYAAAAILAAFVPYGLWSLAPLPPKRRRYVAAVIGISAVFAVLQLVRAKTGMLAAADHALVASFAMFLLTDLVVFHRLYFKEKATRAAEQQQQSVRTVFLPAEREGTHGPFRFEYHYEPAASGGGDWMLHWDEPARDERCLVLGHVQARGPDTTLGVALVVGCLREAKTRGLAFEAMAELLNARLLELYGGQLTTTMMAASTASDGTVELFNAGGAGFFAVSRDGLTRYVLPSSPLGAARTTEVDSCPISFEDGDVLFAATAGVLAQDGIGRLEDTFEEDLDVERDPTAIKGRVLKLGGGAEGEDKTLLILTKPAA